MEPKKSRNTFTKESWKRKHGAKELTPLNNGEKVTLQHGNKWVPATVISKHHTPRSYIVQTPEGQKYWRNRRHYWTNAEHRKTYLEHQRKINPRHHQTPRRLKSGQYLFLLQKQHLHKCRNLQCVLVPDDWSRSLLTLRTMNTSLLLLQTC